MIFTSHHALCRLYRVVHKILDTAKLTIKLFFTFYTIILTIILTAYVKIILFDY